MLVACSRSFSVRRCLLLRLFQGTRGAWTAPTKSNAGDSNKENISVNGDESAPSRSSTVGKFRKHGKKRRGTREDVESVKNTVSQSSHNTEENTSPLAILPLSSTSKETVSSTLAPHSEAASFVDRPFQVHPQLITAAQQHPRMPISETVASSATNVTLEKIERRRKKWTLTEVEFDVGITERLFPEIRRLSVLHELHYGDATMREVDAATYFATACHNPVLAESTVKEEVVEMSLTDADFLAFEDHESMQQSTAPLPSTTPTEVSDCDVANSDKIVAHGIQTPWFLPEGGVVRLEPLAPLDALCLLRFVLYLRQQTLQHLPLAIQQRVKMTEALTEASPNNGGGTRKLLSLEDVMSYLDIAPPPVLGFTENLPPTKSPAFVFVLYTENVSLQNAIGHLAALFSIPQRAFSTCTAVSKMSCGAVLCGVGPNYVQREHLLLLNTMRHPGFVLRVGSISAVEDEERCANLFGELARWQPLNEVELLLRRVSCDSRQELEHRLRAVQEVGAVFFCANREAGLARAATDVLHGFFKSALLNALYRRNAPMAMRQFLARPNPITAARARRASTDSTVRQVLKNYIIFNGDWSKTIARVPYVWRRRWLNALRCSVWNMMASRRLRYGGRRVILGDIVLRPEYRADAHHRMITTVKAEHVMLVSNEEEAARCSVEDVFIPFLRGVYPSELFAPEATGHPIMTQANMLALLREAHAPQLLLGMSDACRQLLDIRSGSSPLLFRRFIIRPIAMTFTILEDKAPVKSIHFDAARQLGNDRLRLQNPHHFGTTKPTIKAGETLQSSVATTNVLPSNSLLISQSVVLERTTIGARLSSGLLAEEFFSLPERDEYVALGHVKRHLQGNFVLAAPRASDDALQTIDRLFTVYVHAVVRNGLSALGHMLREYFILGGVEREDDSALQHKIHRLRREFDDATARLTSPTFCQVCYCRDHDSLEACAEYQFKRNKHQNIKRREEILQQMAAGSTSALMALTPTGGAPVNTSLADVEAQKKESGLSLELELLLRRRSEKEKWGVRLSAALCLTAIDDVSVVAEGRMRFGVGGGVEGNFTAAQKTFWQMLLQQNFSVSTSDDTSAQFIALRHFITEAVGGSEVLSAVNEDTSSNTNFDQGNSLLLPRVCDAFTRLKSLVSSNTDIASTSTPKETNFLQQCGWLLTQINDTVVENRRQVAAVFVRLGKQREVRLQFTTSLRSCGIVVAPPHSNFVGPLPDVVELKITRKDNSKGGWGLKIDCMSLLLLNISDLLLGRVFSALATVVNPSLPPEFANSGAIDGKYTLRYINGILVNSQTDVLETLQNRQFFGEKKELHLRLELLAQIQEKHRSTLPMSDNANKVCFVPVSSASKNEVENSVDTPVANNLICEPGLENHSDERPLWSCSPQCVPLTPAQRRRGVVTIVINRRPEAPAGRWGVRVQRGTVRLQRLQHNHQFSFQVYAAKQQQAVRVADTLRFSSLPSFKSDNHGATVETITRSNNVTFYSHFIYIIIGVNNHRINGIEELRVSLAAAASANEDAVVLQVQQYRLAQIAVTIVRDEVDGKACLESIGLRISREMVIESVEADSSMARAIMAATHEGCSLRDLIHDSHQSVVIEKREGLNGMRPFTDVSSLSASKRWKFDLDEDVQEQTSATRAVENAGTVGDMGYSKTSETQAYWNMVDGVALMEAYGETKTTRFVWRVSYGVRAGPLRTPQDVVHAFAGNVKEETLFLQQCVVDD